MEPYIARCVFYIPNEMQLIQCSLLLSELYMFRAIFSAHHQELIKLYLQPWVHTSGREQESMTIPKAAYTVL